MVAMPRTVNISVNAVNGRTAEGIVMRQLSASRKQGRVVGNHALSGPKKPDSKVALYQVATGTRTWIVQVELPDHSGSASEKDARGDI